MGSHCVGHADPRGPLVRSGPLGHLWYRRKGRKKDYQTVSAGTTTVVTFSAGACPKVDTVVTGSRYCPKGRGFRDPDSVLTGVETGSPSFGVHESRTSATPMTYRRGWKRLWDITPITHHSRVGLQGIRNLNGEGRGKGRQSPPRCHTPPRRLGSRGTCRVLLRSPCSRDGAWCSSRRRLGQRRWPPRRE